MTDNAPVSRLRRCGAPLALMWVALLTACASPVPVSVPGSGYGSGSGYVRAGPDIGRAEPIRPAAPSAPAPAVVATPPVTAAETVPSAPVEPEVGAVVSANAPAVSVQTIDKGLASWYGPRFHGRRTASGERYDMHDFTAAHKTLPFGTKVRVRSVYTGKEVVVRINDRGPYRHQRVIDLSMAAITALGVRERGVTVVELLRE